MKSNETKIDEIEPHAEAGRLTIWETEFVADLCAKVGGGTALTDGQQEKLDEIHERYCHG